MVPILSFGQVENLLVPGQGGETRINYGSVIFKRVEQIDYSDIRGNCFYNKEWAPASLRMNKDWVKVRNARLNLYTNEVSVLDDKGKELVIKKWIVDKILFYDKIDSTKIKAVFQKLKNVISSDSLWYGQVLNSGSIQLIKKTKIELIRDKYDLSLGRHEFRFLSTSKYFISHNGELSLVGLSKKKLFSTVTSTGEYEKWLASNNNKLKTEEDIIEFLNFCQAIKK